MLNNATGNEFMRTPDPMTAAESGAFVVEMEFEFADWTPSSDRIIAQHGDVNGNLGWEIAILTTGQFRLSYFPLGTLASRISSAFTPPLTLLNNQPYGIRTSFLRDFLGVASAYVVDFHEGYRWYYGTIQSAALVASFDCTGDLLVAPGIGVTNLYHFDMYFGKFGIGQLGVVRPNIRGDIALQSLETTEWESSTGHVWTLDGAEFLRSDRPLPYAA
jgi:hypothetical protein